MRRSIILATVSVVLAVFAVSRPTVALPLSAGAGSLGAADDAVIYIRGGGHGGGGGGHGGDRGGDQMGGSHYQNHYSHNYPHYYYRDSRYYNNLGDCYWWAGVHYCNY